MTARTGSEPDRGMRPEPDHRTRPEPDRGVGWRIGQLAEATGVSVRSLRHYDQIGLLVPSGRDGAGHRRYTSAEVRRLQRILALRGFGFSLAETRRLLDDRDADPREVFRRQLAQVDARIGAAHRLRQTLLDALTQLDRSAEPSVRQVLDLIEGMATMERRLTVAELDRMVAERRRATRELSPEQLAELATRRRRWRDRLSPEELVAAQQRRRALLPEDWQHVLGEMRDE